MPRIQNDRNLLFGILALQMNVISREELIEATHEWMNDSRWSLGEILMARNALGDEVCARLDNAVARHVELHGGDLGRGRAGFGSIARSTAATRAGSQTRLDGGVAAGPVQASVAGNEAARGAGEGTRER